MQNNYAQSYVMFTREQSHRQKLLNCAAWNEEQARKAAEAGDAQRAERLARQAEGLREQAEASS